MKQKLFTILLLIGCLAFATSAFGEAVITGATTIGGAAFSASMGVEIHIASSSDMSTSSTKYEIQSGHTSGTTQYCTYGGNAQNADYSKIYRKQTAGVTGLAATDNGQCTGFSAM